MDELHDFCRRMLGDGDRADAAETAARAAGGSEPIAALAAAALACREVADEARAAEETPPPDPAGDLPRAIAREVSAAAGRLAVLDREALALRELLARSYDDIARVTGVPAPEVAPLLAGARLHLRAELRHDPPDAGACVERDRALRTCALRHDGQPVAAADDDWLLDHLGHCEECGRAHAAMLEASACYRAWR